MDRIRLPAARSVAGHEGGAAMTYKARKSSGIFIDRALIASRAWLTLTGAAHAVYLLFRCRLQVRPVKSHRGGRQAFEKVNDGEIVFTYTEAQSKYGITGPRFTRAIEQLVSHGFLDVAYRGGGLEGDGSKYGISDRWQEYGKPGFKEVVRPKGRRLWNAEQRAERAEAMRRRRAKQAARKQKQDTPACAGQTRGHVRSEGGADTPACPEPAILTP
jgi:hypothetical protein